MQMAPIPLYFVYDGFENYLDAALILERIMSVSSTTSNMFTHLQYLVHVLLTSHNVGDNKSYVGINELAAAPSMTAHRWAKYFFQMFSGIDVTWWYSPSRTRCFFPHNGNKSDHHDNTDHSIVDHSG